MKRYHHRLCRLRGSTLSSFSEHLAICSTLEGTPDLELAQEAKTNDNPKIADKIVFIAHPFFFALTMD